MFYVSDLRPTHQNWELPKKKKTKKNKKTEPQSSQSNFENTLTNKELALFTGHKRIFTENL